MNYFSKKDRINNYHLIKQLLKFKSFFEINDMKVSFCIHDLRDVSKLQILISVPKKKIKSSVQRNKIKRLIRESYRLQKSIIDDVILNNKKLAVLLIYNSQKTNMPFKDVFNKINLILCSLKEKYNESI